MGSTRLDALGPTVKTPGLEHENEGYDTFEEDFPGGRLLGQHKGAAGLRIEENISAGGMGLVHSAQQLPLGRTVAVKSLHRDADDDTRQRLIDEAFVIARLEHPNIVPIHDVRADDNGDPLIVMKRIDGVSWEDILDDNSKAPEGERVDTEWQLTVIGKVCDALRFAHSKSIIHCDIKPANVMIGKFGEVFLVDWGIAAYVGDDETCPLPRPGERESRGTPNLAAPELLNQPIELDERTDVYLVGATLHSVLMGTPRHVGKNLSDVLAAADESAPFEYGDDISLELATIINKATAREKEDRYQSIDELWTTLKGYLEHRSSIEMATAARASLAKLHRYIKNDRSQAAINERFIEARFGFKQAVKQWHDNEEAKLGHQETLLTMAEYYLLQGQAEPAAAILATVSPPARGLEQRLHLLRLEKQQVAGAEVELLTLRNASDLAVGQRLRFFFTLGITVFWTISCAVQAYMRWGIPPEQLNTSLGLSILRTTAPPVIMLFVFRKLFLANRANRRFMAGLGGILVTLVLTRIAGSIGGLAVYQVQNLELFLFGMGAIGVGLLTDPRITHIAPLAFLSGLICSAFPEYQMIILGSTNLLGFGYLAWIWRPSVNPNNRSKRGKMPSP